MKKSLLIALALMLVLSFASSAMAAQVLQDGLYLSTSTGVYYPGTTLANIYNKPVAGQFFNDGITNYPYEIYLPNEEDPASYRIHSSYAKNTDACASCHSTHTAVGNTLLQWYSTYETCMACHDGTVTTTYDVQSGKIGVGKPAMGGAFGTTDGFDSNHNVTGALSISAAPGGTTATTETVTLASGQQTRWTPTFGCESCHTPHGNGGNARILHPDANYAASKAVVTTGYYIAVGGSVYTDATEAQRVYILKGYPYVPAVKHGSATGDVVNAAATISNTSGYSIVTGAAVGEKIYGTASLKVKMTIGGYLTQSETVTHDSGMNAFCGACHTDYNTEAFSASNSSDKLTGTYAQAHRHQVGVAPTYNNETDLKKAGMVLEGGKLECLTCHVAHGVNADYWSRTIGDNSALAYLPDAKLEELAGSSALKRVPNMGTCEACHQKGASNEGYGAATDGDDVKDALNFDETNLLAFNSNFGFWSYLTGGDKYVDVATYLSDAGQAAKMDKSFFVAPVEEGGIFEDETYVGSAKCGECHKAYYDVWKVGDHVKAGGNGATLLYPNGTSTVAIDTVVNSKIRGYDAQGALFPYTPNVPAGTATFVYRAGGIWLGNGDTYEIALLDYGTSFQVRNVSASSVPVKVYFKDIMVDGHAGEGYIRANVLIPGSTSKEVYPLDRIFPYDITVPSGTENTFTKKFSPTADLIELADGTLQSEALEPGEGCNACHVPLMNANFAPGVVDAAVSCEACHGPGERHATAPNNVNIFNPGTDFAAVGLSDANAYKAKVNLCLTCHSGSGAGHNTHETSYSIVKHDIVSDTVYGYKRADNGHYGVVNLLCTDCHDIHGSTKDSFVNYDKQEALCGACHGTIGTKAVNTVQAYMWKGGVFKDSRTATANQHGFPSNTLFNLDLYPIN